MGYAILPVSINYVLTMVQCSGQKAWYLYVCRNLWSTISFYLAEGFPEIVEPPVNTTAIEGENVFLSCGITGDPMPFVGWHDPMDTVVRNTRSMFISEENGKSCAVKCPLNSRPVISLNFSWVQDILQISLCLKMFLKEE